MKFLSTPAGSCYNQVIPLDIQNWLCCLLVSQNVNEALKDIEKKKTIIQIISVICVLYNCIHMYGKFANQFNKLLFPFVSNYDNECY